MKRGRAALTMLGAAVALAGVLGARGAPRLTLLNTGIRVEYPRARAASGLATAAGIAVVAATASRRWLRLVLAGIAAIAAGAAADRLRYRLDAGPQALVSRGLMGQTAVAWHEVSRVEAGPEVLVVWGKPDAQVRIVTSDFSPDHRATLERTIARRVAENAPRQQPP